MFFWKSAPKAFINIFVFYDTTRVSSICTIDLLSEEIPFLSVFVMHEITEVLFSFVHVSVYAIFAFISTLTLHMLFRKEESLLWFMYFIFILRMLYTHAHTEEIYE